jgi:hypothetical protein
MKQGNVWLFGLVLAVTLLAGVLFGVFISKTGGLTFDGQVTSGNIFQSCATIASAFLVTLYLQKIVNDHRKQKELLLQQFDQLLELLGQLEDMETSEELTKVVYLLKRISLKCDFISKCMSECGCSTDLIKVADFSNFVKDLRIHSTSTPKQKLEEFTSSKNCPAYVKEGIITWAAERRNEIDVTIEAMKSAIFLAQLKVNRA